MLSRAPARGPNGIIDDELGLVRWISEVPQDPGDPKIFNYAVKMAATDEYLPLICFTNNGGAALTRDLAYRAALGETVERYCSSVFFKEDLTLGSWDEMRRRGRALRPDEIVLFHPDQPDIRYPPFTEDLKICWAPARSVTRREPIMMPASMVYLPYYPFYELEGELTIGPGVSTGQASAYSYVEALLGGLYEVVERDAVSIFWLNRLPLRRIDIESNPRLAQIHKERFARPNLEWLLFDMTTDLAVPSVFCVLIDRARDPALICTGGATHASAERAATKALVEAAQTLQWAKYLGKREEPFFIRPDYANINEFEHHVFLYAYGGMDEAMRFLTDPRDPIALSAIADLPHATPREALAALRGIIEGAGYEIFAADLTSEDVSECGYKVVKVLVPRLQQLEGDHTHRMLASPRLHDVPEKLGYARKRRLSEFNTDPHPYP